VTLHAKKSSGAGGYRDMSKVICFSYHKTGHYASKCPNKKKKKLSEVAATTSTEMDAFAKKFNDESSLVATLSSNGRLAEFEDSGSSCHMMGMRSVFLNVSKTGSDLPCEEWGMHQACSKGG
jgi:hypothetical protein